MKKYSNLIKASFIACFLSIGFFITSCGEEDIIIQDSQTDEAIDGKVASNGNKLNCPSSHPYEACDLCWESEAQAASGGCIDTGGDDGNDDGGSDGEDSNAKLAILDIEINLGIDIDDEFIENCDYEGVPPSINPVISLEDAKIYFRALLGTEMGNQLGDDLNTNGDAWLTRNEASMAKGSDPLQILGTSLGSGLAMDDVLAYIGMYLGDGAIDIYAGDLDPEVQANMAEFTRTWQPDLVSRYGK